MLIQVTMATNFHSLFDMKQIFFTNLQLLGFDDNEMEMKYKMQFNRDMFKMANKAGAEVVLHFLFNRLNLHLCQQEFRDCWPITDKKTEAVFRKTCYNWLQKIQKDDCDARLPRINASLFLSPGGDSFYQLLFAFSSYVLLCIICTEFGERRESVLGHPVLTSHTKDLAPVMETTCHAAAIRHRKRFLGTMRLTKEARHQWQRYSQELTEMLTSLTRESKELERLKRELSGLDPQAVSGADSRLPPSNSPHGAYQSPHVTGRQHKMLRVRRMWKDLEEFVASSQDQHAVVGSITDRTTEKRCLDSGQLNIKVPHIFLRDCEWEIQTCKIDNIYKAGKLNIVSFIQLWNLALKMYSRKLDEVSWQSMSKAAGEMRQKAEAVQAYVTSTLALRERMSEEISQRKKNVDNLRQQFCKDAKLTGPGLLPASPQKSFVRVGNVTDITGMGVSRQNAVTVVDGETRYIATSLSQSSCCQMTPFSTRFDNYPASGVGKDEKCTDNYSDCGLQKPQRLSFTMEESALPQCPSSQQRSHASMSREVRQSSSSQGSTHQDGSIAPWLLPQHGAGHNSYSDLEVLPHGGNDGTSPSTSRLSVHRMPRPLSAALDILADKVASAVMNGEEDCSADDDHLSTTTSPLSQSTSFSSQHTSKHLDNRWSAKLCDSTRSRHSYHRTCRSSVETDGQLVNHGKNSRQTATMNYLSMFETAKNEADIAAQSTFSSQSLELPSGGVVGANGGFGSSKNRPGGAAATTSFLHCHSNQRNKSCSHDDRSLQNTVSALCDDAFFSQDLIHRSPLALEIRQMWLGAIGDSPEKPPDSRNAMNSNVIVLEVESVASSLPLLSSASQSPNTVLEHEELVLSPCDSLSSGSSERFPSATLGDKGTVRALSLCSPTEAVDSFVESHDVSCPVQDRLRRSAPLADDCVADSGGIEWQCSESDHGELCESAEELCQATALLLTEFGRSDVPDDGGGKAVTVEGPVGHVSLCAVRKDGADACSPSDFDTPMTAKLSVLGQSISSSCQQYGRWQSDIKEQVFSPDFSLCTSECGPVIISSDNFLHAKPFGDGSLHLVHGASSHLPSSAKEASSDCGISRQNNFATVDLLDVTLNEDFPSSLDEPIPNGSFFSVETGSRVKGDCKAGSVDNAKQSAKTEAAVPEYDLWDARLEHLRNRAAIALNSWSSLNGCETMNGVASVDGARFSVNCCGMAQHSYRHASGDCFESADCSDIFGEDENFLLPASP